MRIFMYLLVIMSGLVAMSGILVLGVLAGISWLRALFSATNRGDAKLLFIRVTFGCEDETVRSDCDLAAQKAATDAAIAELETQFTIPEIEFIYHPLYGDCVCPVCLRARGFVRG